MKIKIQPIKTGKYNEQCLVYAKNDTANSDFYPVALVHVDTFWNGSGADNDTHRRLFERGETVFLDLDIP